METINKYIVYAIFTLIAISILAGGAYSILIWDIFPFAIVTIAFVVTGLIWVFGPKKLVIIFLAVLIMVGLISIYNAWQVVVAKTNSAIIESRPIYVFVEPEDPGYLDRFYPSAGILLYFVFSVILGIISHIVWRKIGKIRRFEVYAIIGGVVVVVFFFWPIEVYSHDKEIVNLAFVYGIFLNTIVNTLTRWLSRVVGFVNFLARKSNNQEVGDALTWAIEMDLVFNSPLSLALHIIFIFMMMSQSSTISLDVVLVTIMHAKFVSMGYATLYNSIKRKLDFYWPWENRDPTENYDGWN